MWESVYVPAVPLRRHPFNCHVSRAIAKPWKNSEVCSLAQFHTQPRLSQSLQLTGRRRRDRNLSMQQGMMLERRPTLRMSEVIPSYIREGNLDIARLGAEVRAGP